MGTRNTPGVYDCAAKALDDEPTFTILARDRHGAAVVRQWALQRDLSIKMGNAPESDRAMVEEARDVADQMEAWREGNWPARKGEAA